MQSYYSCQSGRSMVEILGVLAVIGVLSVGGIAAYSKAMEKINTDQLIVDISTTARKIKNLYADQKSYEDLDQQVYTLNLVAGAHKIEGMNKKLLHIFNGELIVDISTTARKIKNLYADQKSYEDLDQQVYTLNLVAGAHKIEGMNKKLLHIFNGEVFVKSIALNKGFVMVYNGLTEKACATLASTDWGNGSTGLKYLVVSPTGIIPLRGYPSNLDSGEYEAKDIPLSPAEAAAHCNCDAFYKCGIAWFYE